MKAEPILAAESIGKRYGRREILTAASLWLYPGRITAMLGRNGIGKSTLLKIAAGWIAPNYGLVIFKEQRLLRPRLARLARDGLFFLPERSLLCTYRTVRQHLDAQVRAFPGAAAEEAIEVFRLAEFLDRKPAGLSGGERRRTEVALAWTRHPDCLLADEPFMGLAPADQEFLAGAFRTMASRGVAIGVTGHEVASLLDVADEVIWMTAGTTHSLGAPAAARANDQFMRDYLGPTALGATARRASAG